MLNAIFVCLFVIVSVSVGSIQFLAICQSICNTFHIEIGIPFFQPFRFVFGFFCFFHFFCFALLRALSVCRYFHRIAKETENETAERAQLEPFRYNCARHTHRQRHCNCNCNTGTNNSLSENHCITELK